MYVLPASRNARLLGVALVTSGLTLLAALTIGGHITVANAARALAIVLSVAGALVLVYGALRSKGRSIEEAYRLGYDVGYEGGFRAGCDAHVASAVKSLTDKEHHAARDPRLVNGSDH